LKQMKDENKFDNIFKAKYVADITLALDCFRNICMLCVRYYFSSKTNQIICKTPCYFVILNC